MNANHLLVLGSAFSIGAILPNLEVEVKNFYYNRIKWNTAIDRNVFYRYNEVLERKYEYYRMLNAEGRARFINRTISLMNEWEFEGRDGLVITAEKRLLVCASAVQLTFGLKVFHIEQIRKIALYPDIFYSQLVDANVKGLTYGIGLVSFSWKSFEEGYQVYNDRYNLGLHEMAHALKISALKEYNNDRRFEFYLDHFMNFAWPEYLTKRSQENGFLREYASHNEHEFFAVCVEHFFEVPLEFKQNLPNIYHHLCVLLNQDPLNTANNYRLEDDFYTNINSDKSLKPVPKIVKSIEPIKSSWASVLLIINSIASLVILGIIAPMNSQNDILLELIFAGGLCFAAAFQYFQWRKSKDISLVNIFFSLIYGATLAITCTWAINHIGSRKMTGSHNIESILCNADKQCTIENDLPGTIPLNMWLLSNYSLGESKFKESAKAGLPMVLEMDFEMGSLGLVIEDNSYIMIPSFPPRVYLKSGWNELLPEDARHIRRLQRKQEDE